MRSRTVRDSPGSPESSSALPAPLHSRGSIRAYLGRAARLPSVLKENDWAADDVSVDTFMMRLNDGGRVRKAAASAALVLGLAACGSSSNPPSNSGAAANSGTPTTTATTVSASSSGVNAYATCKLVNSGGIETTYTIHVTGFSGSWEAGLGVWEDDGTNISQTAIDGQGSAVITKTYPSPVNSGTHGHPVTCGIDVVVDEDYGPQSGTILWGAPGQVAPSNAQPLDTNGITVQ